MQEITLLINGEQYTVHIKPNDTLLSVLREQLYLTGAKYGCGTGDCGACKVIIDGEAVNSCTIQARNVVGKSIRTIEGVGTPTSLHPVQRAFVDSGAIQCGFCTPGMVMTSIALLEKNPDPSEDEVIASLDGNICRCTGYKKIVEAILLASKLMKEAK